MPYPSTVTAFTNPQPTDKLNSPSHSSIETAQNTGLTEIQTFVGTLSSAVGTLVYDIRSADSNGGGHVQTANKGGTGQTAYTKGDLLIAQSASALSKLSVGSDGQVLTADSSVATGIKWASNPTAFTNKIAVSSSVQTFGVSATAASDVSILSVTVPGSVLLSDNVVKATVYIGQFSKNLTAGSVLLKANYGSNTVASVLVSGSYSTSPSMLGKIEYTLIAKGSSVLQAGYLDISLSQAGSNGRITTGPFVSSVIWGRTTGSSSVNGSANQTLGLTALWDDSSTGNQLTIQGYTVEKLA